MTSIDPGARSSTPFEPAGWRVLRSPEEEPGLAHRAAKHGFWSRTLSARARQIERRTLNLTRPSPLADAIVARRGLRAGVVRTHRPGNEERDYDTRMLGWMDETTPQFNLRNVARVTRDVDWEYRERASLTLPDRHGYRVDLQAVRDARHEPPDLSAAEFASGSITDYRAMIRTLFVENDWEQWYGEDKKRAMGALWRWVPADGGRRTRAWPEMVIVPHVFWRGRLIVD